jgi:uncharacterized protein with von Willebrand factor type A (vWA) domain
MKRRKGMKERIRWIVGCALVVALAAGVLARSGPRPVPKPVVYVNFDVSGSQSRAERLQLCGLLEQTVDQVLPGGSHLVVTAFDESVRLQYNAPVVEASQLAAVEKRLLGMKCQQDAKTRPAAALTDTLDRLRRLKTGVPAAVVFLWDGEDCDHKRTQQLAEHLAKLPISVVWVAGVSVEAKEDLRRQVERSFQALGDRLVVSSPDEYPQGLEAFAVRLGGP